MEAIRKTTLACPSKSSNDIEVNHRVDSLSVHPIVDPEICQRLDLDTLEGSEMERMTGKRCASWTHVPLNQERPVHLDRLRAASARPPR